jgi:hypothetical protein
LRNARFDEFGEPAMAQPCLRFATAVAAVLAVLSTASACAVGPAAEQPAGADKSPVSVPGSSAGPGSVYIEDFDDTSTSDPYDSRETASINGADHPHSQGAQFCFGDKDRKWEYDLGRKYARFHAVVGLDDDSATETVVRYEVIGDGRVLYSQDVGFGMSLPVDVSVENVLRLRLVTTLLSKEGSCGAATAQWGEVRADPA